MVKTQRMDLKVNCPKIFLITIQKNVFLSFIFPSFLYLFVCFFLSFCLSVCLLVCLCLSDCLITSLSVLSLYSSICYVSVNIHLGWMSICISKYSPICLSVCLSVCLSFHLTGHEVAPGEQWPDQSRLRLGALEVLLELDEEDSERERDAVNNHVINKRRQDDEPAPPAIWWRRDVTRKGVCKWIVSSALRKLKKKINLKINNVSTDLTD